MAALSRDQVIQLLLQNGATQAQAELYAAIGQGESGLDPNAHGDISLQDSKWGPSVGIMQVRSLKADYGTGRTRDALRLTDPAFNIASAREISGGWTNAKPWTVYTSGAYKQYLGGGGSGAAGGGGAVTKNEVMALQRQLNEKGAGLVVDGINGPKTQAAQAKYGISGPGAAAGSSALDEARSRYGAFASYLDDPVIGPILQQGAREGRDAAWLEGQLSQTEWWKTTSDTARAWELVKKTDPATAQASIASTSAQLSAAAQAAGVTISPARLTQLAEDAQRFGWNAAQVKQAMAAEYHYDPNVAQSGQVAATQELIRNLGREYGVPIQGEHQESVYRAVLAGTMDQGTLNELFIKAAKLLFPTIADDLDKGITVRQYYAPYAAAAAKFLEISPEEIDLTDGKWQRPLNQIDPKTGQRGVMSVWDWETTLKTDDSYNWRYTKNAKEDYTSAAAQISKAMGRVA